MEKAGFIGLGIMGKPMARNLLKKGVELMVFDLDLASVDELVALGAERGSAESIGRECRYIFTILPTGAIVQSVLFGEGGVAQYLSPGKIVCDMSSVTPGESRACYERLRSMGVGFVDAPVSGGEPKAIRGGLAGSVILDNKAPMMCARDFRPGGTIAVNRKDIKNVLATAHEIDVPLPFTAQLYEIQQALKIGGHLGDDHSGYIQYFEQLAGVEVRSDSQQ